MTDDGVNDALAQAAVGNDGVNNATDAARVAVDVALVILNDGIILTISKDNLKASPLPDSWKLKQVIIISICLGLY